MRKDQPKQDQPQVQDQQRQGLPTRGLPTRNRATQDPPTQGLPKRGLPTRAPARQGLPTRIPSKTQDKPQVQEQPPQVIPAPASSSQIPPAQSTPQIQALPEIEDLYQEEVLPEVETLPQLEEQPTQVIPTNDKPAQVIPQEAVAEVALEPTKDEPVASESAEDKTPEDKPEKEEKPKEPQVLISAPILKRKDEPEKKKRFFRINKSQTFAIFCLVVFILCIPIPISPDPLPDPLPEFVRASIDVTPKALDFENMQLGSPRTTIVTVSNVSENNVSIYPLMTFDSNSAPYLTSKLEDCSSGSCIPVTYATKIAIPKGGQHKLTLTVTMTQNIGSTPITGDFKITGEVVR